MGLTTTHGCWDGSCTSFNNWRRKLHSYASPGDSRTLDEAWVADHYADQSKPINVLMNHSDCDGDIPAEVCGPLADALQEIADRMRADGSDTEALEDTEVFIAGLRGAEAYGEAVEFR